MKKLIKKSMKKKAALQAEVVSKESAKKSLLSSQAKSKLSSKAKSSLNSKSKKSTSLVTQDQSLVKVNALQQYLNEIRRYPLLTREEEKEIILYA